MRFDSGRFKSPNDVFQRFGMIQTEVASRLNPNENFAERTFAAEGGDHLMVGDAGAHQLPIYRRFQFSAGGFEIMMSPNAGIKIPRAAYDGDEKQQPS